MFSVLFSKVNLNRSGEQSRLPGVVRSRLLTTVSVILLTVSFISPSNAQFLQQDPDWVTTWTTSPSTLPPTEPATETLNNQTVRLIAHSSVGGSAVRLRLSNTHGDRPIHIGAVSIALQATGTDFRDGSNRNVMFSKRGYVTVPRGATVISDPIGFDVQQSGNLVVSLYIPNQSGFVTTHALANQTSYISTTGDYTDSNSMEVAEETSGWPFLTAIDVLPSQPTSAIVTLGDSITDGWGSTDSANQRWPNHFAHRLYSDNSVQNYAVINAGISGNRVTTEESPRFGQNLQTRFERDVLALSNVSHIILLEGINDIGMSSREGSPIDATEIIAGYRQIIARAHARGIKVIGATLLPYEGAGYYTKAGNEHRKAVNDFIRDSGEFDGVIEFDKAVQDPGNPNRIRADFTADNLHPNDEGYAAMAEIIDLNLFR